MKRSALLPALLLCLAASFALTLAPGDSVTITGCTTSLELTGNVVRCATESVTPTTVPSATATNTATTTSTPTATATSMATATATATWTATPFVPTATSGSLGSGVAVIGDSTQDEYRANDARGWPYGATTFNSIELLVRLRGLPVGAWGTRPEPRRTGYEFNWARSGAVTYGAETSQAPGVVSQAQAGRVGYVLVQIGSNDFQPGALADGYAIYTGSLSGDALTSALNTVADRTIRAYRQLLAVLPASRVIVADVQDYLTPALVPEGYTVFTDPAGRVRYANALAYLNGRVKAAALADGVRYFDFNAALLAEANARRSGQSIVVGGRLVDTRTRGNDPLHTFLQDSYAHPGTLLSGLIANLWISEANASWGVGLPLLTDAEIISAAGVH